MEIGSPAFDNGKRLPRAYVRGGDNQSPPLHWWGAPADARSFMIVCDDIDAPNGGFHHWGYFNIPQTYGDLPEGAGRIGQPTGHQAINGFGEPRYDGPEPPVGKGPHRRVHGGAAGHQDDVQVGKTRFQAPHQFEAVQIGHPDIDNRQVRNELGGDGESVA